MAKLSAEQIVLLRSIIDEAVSARRRNAAKSTRPEFKVVYERELAELLNVKPLIGDAYGEQSGASGNKTR